MKKFYTDKDIEDLFNSGVKSLRMDDDVVLTDLAFEKARKLGMLEPLDAPPAAPVRPYLSQTSTAQSRPGVDSVPLPPPPPPKGEGRGEGRRAALEKRIREQVAAKLGDHVDASLLDAIIKRTLKAVRLK